MLRVETEGDIRVLRLDRPPVNAFSKEAYQDICDLVDLIGSHLQLFLHLLEFDLLCPDQRMLLYQRHFGKEFDLLIRLQYLMRL